MKQSQLFTIIIILLAQCQVFHECANLPKLWKSDPSTKPDGFYRFFYRLEIFDYSDPAKYKSFLIEEWVHLRESRVRLDILPLDGGVRRTILSYGDTGEVFYYEPFKCFTADKLNEALYPELVDIFPKNEDSYLKFGIGSLWLHVEISNADNVSSSSPGPTTVKLDTYLPLEYATNSTKSSKFTYNSSNGYRPVLTFYMSDRNNVNTLSLIWIGSKYKIRVMDTPNELRQSRDKIEKVFQLPQGYGCVRSKSKDSECDGNEEMYLVPLAPMSLDPSELRLLRLDVISSRPIDDSGDSGGRGGYYSPDRWRSHSSSVRILSGGYRASSGDYERNYMIFERQESSSDRDSVARYLSGIASSRRATVERTKMVWDMSNLGSGSRSRFYELDASEGKCLGYGETNSPLEVGINLHIAPAAYDFDLESPPLLLTVGIELLSNMFSPDGYKLISCIDYARVDKKELVFERRDESFKVYNMRGEIVWEGPVSMVRQIIAPAKRGSNNDGSIPTQVDQEKITINFYTKNLDKLLARVKFIVAELETIDQLYLLNEIDVSDCLLRLGQTSKGVAGTNYVDELPISEQQLNEDQAFELEYFPMDEDSYGKFVLNDQEDHLKQLIKMEFINSLVKFSNFRLDLMQITRLEIDIRQADVIDDTPSSAIVKITGQILDRPNLLNFNQDPGQKFADTNQKIRSLLKESAKSCAASCDHFNCTMFTYCSGSSVCDLLLDEDTDKASDESADVKVTWEPNCVLFTRHDLARSMISSEELLHHMSQQIRTQPEDLALNLHHTLSLTPILLVPQSIRTGTFHSQEFEELAELDDLGDEDSRKQIQSKRLLISAPQQSTGYKQEYSLLIRDKKYRSNMNDRTIFPLAEANHFSYQDCESLCKRSDCLSFSYCKLEKLCRISNLHKMEHIEPKIEQDSGCVVMAREYLTKFEKVSQKPLKPRQTFQTIRVESLSECATNCMEQNAPQKCRSFYYCPTGRGRASCHLKSNNILPDIIASPLSTTTPNSMDRVSSQACDLYARSHLSDFNKFYGKSLPITDLSATFTSQLFRGHEAESCASECANEVGKCTGFQVCSSSGDFVCTIFSTGLNSSLVSRLTPSSGCTFFSISPGSELYQLASNKLSDQVADSGEATNSPAGTTDAKQQPRLQQQRSELSLWLLRILFVSIGLLLGYGLIYVPKKSPSMRNTIRQLMSRFPRSLL